MRIHFIAIGGAAMHNLAIALQQKGFEVTGSDDEIFEPSRSRLAAKALLPESFGWHADKIDTSINAVILGMHAREDNPELLRAREIGLKIYSYPEFLYEQTKNKKRIVIAGSHGKTTITSMVMHVLKEANYKFDYMVGAQIEGFETMVHLSNESEFAVFEGDEYLSSPIDLRSKFLHYKPHIAVINGIAWDHINVFPTYQKYLNTFRQFIKSFEAGGKLIYYKDNSDVGALINEVKPSDMDVVAYDEPEYSIDNENVSLIKNGKEWPIHIFGRHNIQNLQAACEVCNAIGVDEQVFLEAISTFKGSARRMQLLAENEQTKVYLDFAHAPSKVKATIEAIREQYSNRHIIACLELHTYSSLNKNFIGDYAGTMSAADTAAVYFNPEVLKHKNLPTLKIEDIKEAFNNENIKVFDNKIDFEEFINDLIINLPQIYLFMSSGNFGGLKQKDFVRLAKV